MGEIEKLPNIGKVVAQQLSEVGIGTYAELKKVGAKEAWLRIQKIDKSACIHRLYAIEGAIEGIKKTQLAPEMKADLKTFYDQHKM